VRLEDGELWRKDVGGVFRMMVLSMLCGVLARLGRDAWSRDLHFTAQIAIGYLHINYPRHFRITKRTVLIWNNVTLVFSSIILAPDMAHARSLYLFSNIYSMPTKLLR
jgi:hypothetical protein